jgi:hypothetical protein
VHFIKTIETNIVHFIKTIETYIVHFIEKYIVHFIETIEPLGGVQDCFSLCDFYFKFVFVSETLLDIFLFHLKLHQL